MNYFLENFPVSYLFPILDNITKLTVVVMILLQNCQQSPSACPLGFKQLRLRLKASICWDLSFLPRSGSHSSPFQQSSPTVLHACPILYHLSIFILLSFHLECPSPTAHSYCHFCLKTQLLVPPGCILWSPALEETSLFCTSTNFVHISLRTCFIVFLTL